MEGRRSNGRTARMSRRWKSFFTCCAYPRSIRPLASSYSTIPAANGDRRSDVHEGNGQEYYLRGDPQVASLGEGMPTTKAESAASARVTLERLLLGEGVEWVEEERELEHAEEAAAQQQQHGIRSPGGGWWCCVCMGRRKKGAAFISCGHTFCRDCAWELLRRRGSCPLCNRAILDILDIY